MSMRGSDSPINHAKCQKQQRETNLFTMVVESNRIGLSAMSDDHKGRKDGDETGASEKDSSANPYVEKATQAKE